VNIQKIRADFPILTREVKPGIPLVYLDSTATSQKPHAVIQAMDDYYRKSNANIHRGLHTLAEEATALYEQARSRTAKFIGAQSAREIIFTRNATESVNLVARTWGRMNLAPGDIIILTEMEHHSNLVPWQMLSATHGVRLEFIPVNADGRLDLDAYVNLLKLEPKLVAFTHMSNVLGTITPAKEMIELAHQAGALVLLDAAQSVPHFSVSVKEANADFMVFSAHKMCGPTGIGVLYGKKKLLEEMPPYMGGGDMIKKVHLRSFVANEIPHKFEAGTPAIAEAVGLNTAVDYLDDIGMSAIAQHEHEIVSYALERLEEIPGLHIFGPSVNNRGGVVSFYMDGVHPHDIAQVLDSYGVAIRAGHHCAMPLHEKFGITATARASFYLYNTLDEVDTLVKSIYQVQKLFRL
jgi:cysteine desulfurase/selenocysteine lyase